jgi:transcriptional regulator with XRE-family HTH domain
MTGGGSVVVRRQLGFRLRQLRLKAGKDLGDVAEAGLASRAKLSRIENGKLPVRVADVWALCRLYGVDQPTTDALAALSPGTQQDDWWEQYGEAVPDWLGLYAGLEASASRIRCFEADVVHGLLQTATYAALVIGADDPRVLPAVVDRAVQFRMQRQQSILDADTAPDMTLIMEEGALAFGPPDVMTEQVDHLRTMASRPNIEILVLPFSAGTYPRRGTFTLLDFKDMEDPSVVYVEIPMGAKYFDRPTEREDYEYVFGIIKGKSIPIKEWKQ